MPPQLKNEADRQKLINKGLKLLSFRPRSVSEIKFRLSKLKVATPALVKEVLDYLIDTDLLDDHKFAAWWVEQRSNHKPKGNIALKSELFQKGIDQSIIKASLLSSEDEKKLANKSLKSKKIVDRQKAYQYLYSRGFTSEIINSSIDEIKTRA